MKELLTSFGQLKAFNLVKDVTSGLSKVWLKYLLWPIGQVVICWCVQVLQVTHIGTSGLCICGVSGWRCHWPGYCRAQWHAGAVFVLIRSYEIGSHSRFLHLSWETRSWLCSARASVPRLWQWPISRLRYRYTVQIGHQFIKFWLFFRNK